MATRSTGPWVLIHVEGSGPSYSGSQDLNPIPVRPHTADIARKLGLPVVMVACVICTSSSQCMSADRVPGPTQIQVGHNRPHSPPQRLNPKLGVCAERRSLLQHWPRHAAMQQSQTQWRPRMAHTQLCSWANSVNM